MFSRIRPQLLCCRSAHNLNNLFSDLRLAHAVHSERQRINHVCGIVCGRIHGSHASGVLGGNRFEQRMKDLNAHVLRQERVEQLFRGLLVDVVHLCGCESGSFSVYGPSVDRTDTNAGPLRRLERAVTLLRGHLFRLRHANFAHTFDRKYLLDNQPNDRESGIFIVGEQIGVLTKLEYSIASEFAQRVIDRYSEQRVDSVYLLYNEFKSVISQRLVVEKVLPIERVGEVGVAQAEEMTAEERHRALEAAKGAGVGVRPIDTRAIDAEAARFATAQVDYIYEQPPEELFNALLPKYVGIQIFHGLLESVAAEHAARMTAMDAATNNATDMIDSLTLAMNRVRQAKITKEIIEIVSGAAAQ